MIVYVYMVKAAKLHVLYTELLVYVYMVKVAKLLIILICLHECVRIYVTISSQLKLTPNSYSLRTMWWYGIIGDHFYKQHTALPLEDQMISAMPDIQIATLSPDDQFFVVACDGIW